MEEEPLADRTRRLSTQDLILHHSEVLDELRVRRLLRTDADLGPDLAEVLVRDACGGTLHDSRINEGWDVLYPDRKTRVQVKSRTRHDQRKSNRLIRWTNWNFDRCVIVLFEKDYSVAQAVDVPKSALDPTGEGKPLRLDITRALALEGAEDVAPRLRKAMAELP